MWVWSVCLERCLEDGRLERLEGMCLERLEGMCLEGS